MKLKTILFSLYFCIATLGISAQTITTVANTAGNLSTQLTNPSAVTHLVITGTMNETDFTFIRENCKNLVSLDVSGTNITSVPANALSRTASNATSFSLTVGGCTPRYTAAGKQVIFVNKTATISSIARTFTLSDGATVSPDPSTCTFTDATPVTFTVTAEDGKTTQSYTYVVTLDDWFTMLVEGDPEVNMTRNSVTNTVANVTRYFTNAVALTTGYTDLFSYSTYSFIKPKVEIVFSLGDMDADRQTSHSTIEGIFDLVINAGIPLITLYGNHDWDPESWGDGTYGFNATGRSANNVTLTTVKKYANESAALSSGGISDLHWFESGTSGYVQPDPFAFKFRNVQFMMGQRYWFNCPFKSNSTTQEAPDAIINNVVSYISSQGLANVPTVWMQHYPLYAGSDIERWWTNQDANWVSGGSGTSSTAPYSYNITTDYSTYALKLAKYKEMIRSTKNPAHFSGHYHTQTVTSFPTGTPAFNDYTCAYGGIGGAYLVLARESTGVVEVKNISLDY